MKVTVFMPAYNTEKYIKEAIESILNQTFSDFELLIIDDGSTDKTVEIIKKIDDKRIRLVQNKKNMGLPYTRNLGLDLAIGEYIAIMDSDDIAISDRLEKQVNYLDNNKNIILLGGACSVITEKGEVENYINSFQNANYLRASLLFHNYIPNSTIMFRRGIIKKENIRYDEKCFIGQDYKFLVDISNLGEFTCLQEIVLKYRVGQNSVTKRSCEQHLINRLEVMDYIKKSFMDMYELNLNEDESKLFLKVFSEGGKIESTGEVREIFYIFKKLKYQYDNNKYDGKKEFTDILRIKFCDRLKTMREIWDL